jgi:hypothetical protein
MYVLNQNDFHYMFNKIYLNYSKLATLYATMRFLHQEKGKHKVIEAVLFYYVNTCIITHYRRVQKCPLIFR